MASAAVALCLLTSPVQGRTHKKAHPAPVQDTGSKVTAVRYWTLGDVTRVAIEVSDEFQFKSDRLNNPDRLFFDIIGAKPGLGKRGMSSIQVGDPLLKQIRVAETQHGTTRVVLDLQGSTEFTASQLSSPERLMIELRNPDTTVPSIDQASTASHTIPAVSKTPPAPDMIADQPPALPASRPQENAAVRAISNSPAVPEPPRTPRDTKPVSIAAKTDQLDVPPATPRSSTSGIDAAPTAARRGSVADRSLTRVLGLKLGRVVIDPGHGGHDFGTSGPTGLHEKDLVLDVAQRLGALIERRLNSEVIYTRSDDTFIPLQERTAIANEHKADLFLSIHANSSPATSASGVESYYLNFTTSKSALEVAARENAASDHSIYDLKDLVQQITLKDKVEESREFAAKVQGSMMPLASRANNSAKDRGVRKAPFVVLIGASMPSILVEVGFLSNPKDEAMMKKPEYRQKMAEALYKGVAQYAAGLSHFQVAARKRDEPGQTATGEAGR
jgi:N-acetylmuramoyl-L-alanine amidase